jgi:hypothetical protein
MLQRGEIVKFFQPYVTEKIQLMANFHKSIISLVAALNFQENCLWVLTEFFCGGVMKLYD